MTRLASGTPSPDSSPRYWRCVVCRDDQHRGEPWHEEQCLVCGAMIRSCARPIRGSLRTYHNDCPGRMPEPERLERYESGFPKGYVTPGVVKDGRVKR